MLTARRWGFADGSLCAEQTYFGQSICQNDESNLALIPFAGGFLAADSLDRSFAGYLLGDDDATTLFAVTGVEAFLQVGGLAMAIAGHAMKRPRSHEGQVGWSPVVSVGPGGGRVGVVGEF